MFQYRFGVIVREWVPPRQIFDIQPWLDDMFHRYGGGRICGRAYPDAMCP